MPPFALVISLRIVFTSVSILLKLFITKSIDCIVQVSFQFYFKELVYPFTADCFFIRKYGFKIKIFLFINKSIDCIEQVSVQFFFQSIRIRSSCEAMIAVDSCDSVGCGSVL